MPQEATAERIAAATVNQTRTAKGETKEPKSPTERAQARRDMASAGRKGARMRTSASGRTVASGVFPPVATSPP